MRGDDTHVIYFSIDRDLVRTIESNIKNTNPEYSSRWLGYYLNTWLNFRNYQCNITALVIWCQHISFIEHAIREDCDRDHFEHAPGQWEATLRHLSLALGAHTKRSLLWCYGRICVGWMFHLCRGLKNSREPVFPKFKRSGTMLWFNQSTNIFPSNAYHQGPFLPTWLNFKPSMDI